MILNKLVVDEKNKDIYKLDKLLIEQSLNPIGAEDDNFIQNCYMDNRLGVE